MNMKKNHGVSFIEILIAMVIFVICIIPITNQLMTGMRISQKADDQQAAIEYAKSVAETMKQMELRSTYEATGNTTIDNDTDQALENIKDNLQLTTFVPGVSLTSDTPVNGHNFYTINSSNNPGSCITSATVDNYETVSDMYAAVNKYNEGKTAEQREALVREYSFIGEGKGIDYRDYIVHVSMSTRPYAIEDLTGSTTYTDPNAVNLGNLSSLDSANTVLLTDTSNCDTEAYKVFFSRIVSELEAEGTFSVLINNLKNGSQKLPGVVTKKIVIDVDNPDAGSSKICKVTCTVVYEMTMDVTTLPGTSEERAELAAAFSDMNKVYYSTEKCQEYAYIPEIYLMYNQFLYDGQYKSDVIQVNNNLTEKKTVNVYVIRTAEDTRNVSDISPVTEATTEESGTTESNIVNLLPQNLDRDDKQGVLYRFVTTFQINSDSTITPDSLKDHPVHIYTNITLDTDTDNKLQVQSGVIQGTGLYKLATNVTSADGYVMGLDDDERYSEEGRLYEIVVTLYDPETYDKDKTPEENESSKIIEFDTTKGDY